MQIQTIAQQVHASHRTTRFMARQGAQASPPAFVHREHSPHGRLDVNDLLAEQQHYQQMEALRAELRQRGIPCDDAQLSRGASVIAATREAHQRTQAFLSGIASPTLRKKWAGVMKTLSQQPLQHENWFS